MEPQDRRIKRTQKLLAQALIELTLEKGYERVSIRDITERADIGYATFFRHYRDKDALLQDVLEVVLENLLVLLLPKPAPLQDPVHLGKLIFEYVRENSLIVRVLLESRGVSSLTRRMIEVGTEKVREQNLPLEEGSVPFQIAAHHLVTSSISLIQWWLENGMPYPPEQMGKIYATLIYKPTEEVAFKASQFEQEEGQKAKPES